MHLGEAQDVARLDIPMHPAAGVQLLQILSNVQQSLQTCGCVVCSRLSAISKVRRLG